MILYFRPKKLPQLAEAMKPVLFLKSAPGMPVHGADISVFERFSLLRGHGWEGTVISSARADHCKSFLDILAKLQLALIEPVRLLLVDGHIEPADFVGEG